jgi:hypothetical protein
VCDWLKKKTRGSFSHELIEIVEKMMADRELERDFACLMLSNLKVKPSKETILRVINETAKLEFDFILNGLQIDLIKTDTDDIIQLIDKKTKDLKAKVMNDQNKLLLLVSCMIKKRKLNKTHPYFRYLCHLMRRKSW